MEPPRRKRSKMDDLVVGEDIKAEVFRAIKAAAAWCCHCCLYLLYMFA